MPDFPPPLSGNSPQVTWLNRLLAACKSMRGLEGPGTLTTVTPFGTHRQSTVRQRGGAGGGSVGVQLYILISHAGDYLVCYKYGDEAQTPVNVAKPYKLRYSITAATTYGDSISYAYDAVLDNQHRTATSATTGLSEEQVIVPEYLTGDLIFVATADHTGVFIDDVELTLIDIHSRVWAKQTPPPS